VGKPSGGLTEWFGKGPKGDWVDIGAPKKKGKFQKCGRKSAKGKSKRKYPKCVPRAKARAMTPAQRRSAVRRKRAAGNPGGKPTNVKTILKKAKGGPIKVSIARGCGAVKSNRRKKTKYF
tara:strand:- start:2892 stop:3251 length:360 start_codon:yes stop_codon:yes gene_type:complete